MQHWRAGWDFEIHHACRPGVKQTAPKMTPSAWRGNGAVIKLFFAVFGGAFVVMVAGLAIAPNLVLGAYQDDVVQAWSVAGVDTSSCETSVPRYGIGTRECYEGSIKDLARKLSEADGESEANWNDE